jgi:K+/H+ antiporter YhaU regulatory subunit KhtT
MKEKRKIVHLSRRELVEIYESTESVSDLALRYNTTVTVIEIVKKSCK